MCTDGVIRTPVCPLSTFLRPRLPDSVSVSDASLDVLSLLRVLHALSRHWGTLYNLPHYKSLLPQQVSTFFLPLSFTYTYLQIYDEFYYQTLED